MFKENVRIALGSIKSQLLRTILTVLIIAVGITALVGILTLVAALENTLSSDFATMGSNTFNISRYDSKENLQSDEERKVNAILSYTQVKEFTDRYSYPATQTSISFVASTAAEVKYENTKTDPEISVVGVDDYYLSNSGLQTTLGRNFTRFDIQNNSHVCIIGSDLEKALFKDFNPIDKTISIRGSKFKVIGTLKEKGSTFGNSQDLRVLIPIQLARSMYSAADINYALSVMTDKKELLDASVDQAILTMRQVRKLNPIEENDFGISRSDDLINRILDLTQYLGWAAWIIGIITIFGSSIALMNIMLVSVTERTREIGVRKALGAKKVTIATQFFIETLLIGQMGGFVGIVLGILIGFFIGLALDFSFVIPWMAIFAAFATTFVVAVVSGLYPAIKASKLDPIEALRYE